jgi:broad specificity phosphatase PhoE
MPPIAIGAFNDRMSALFLLRHGPTEWTAARRLQGRSDIPLSAAGRSVVETWQLPERAGHGDWISSPLGRAMETAAILRRHYRQAAHLVIEPRLVEMSFGEWEGQTLAGLRSIHGPVMAEREGRGLDFRPPGGESPRDVQERLRPWLERLAAENKDVLAITHKGVVRALYALASGWDMRGKAPHRLVDNVAHEFELDRTGIHIRRLNIPLQQPARPAEAPA